MRIATEGTDEFRGCTTTAVGVSRSLHPNLFPTQPRVPLFPLCSTFRHFSTVAEIEILKVLSFSAPGPALEKHVLYTLGLRPGGFSSRFPSLQTHL